MTERWTIVATLLLGFAGLGLLGWLTLRGVDPRAAQAAGPRWRRRLVTAALCLLTACGFATPAAAHPALTAATGDEAPGSAAGPSAFGPSQDEPSTFGSPAVSSALPPSLAGPASRAELDRSPRWRTIVRSWNEAELIASGKKGSYPFDQAGKKRILGALGRAQADADALCAEGLLSATESALLKKDLGTLVGRVSAFRPTEMQMATCYEPMMLQPGKESLDRLADRLPLLEKLAASGTIHPQVLEKVSEGIERDLAVLGKAENLARMSADEKERARKVAAQVRLRLQQMRSKTRASGRSELLAWSGDGPHADGLAGPVPPKSGLQASEAWQRVQRTWTEAMAVASGKKGQYPFDEAGKARLLKALEKALTDVQALQAQGLITAPEALLLADDLRFLTDGVQRKRPTEMQNATCYKPMMFQPAKDSLRRLSERLPLLERMAASKTVHPEVVSRVAATMRRDVEILDQHAADLDPAERQRATKVRKDVRARLEQIEKRTQKSTGAGPSGPSAASES